MSIWMLTMPWTAANKKIIKIFLEEQDIHKWVIGYEIGRGGYKHIHVRLQFGGDFAVIKRYFNGCHIEEGSDDWKYEKKDGHFVAWDDTPDVRRCRFGKLRNHQDRILSLLDRQSDREILVWYDRTGGIGKSFFTRWLVERRRAYYVPPTVDNVKQIIQWVCSGYQGEPYIVIDIPRSAKWNQSLYTGIESIKDGIVYDTRYSASMRDIWGVKIIVLTNGIPKLDALSRDRWVIANRDGLDCTRIAWRIAQVCKKG